MRRTILTAATLLTVATLTTGCGMLRRGPHYYEVEVQVTGAAEKISWVMPPGEPNLPPNPPTDVAAPTTPWAEMRVTTGGDIKIQVTPKDGPVSCRILVEKKQVTKKDGRPGGDLVCKASIEK